jgi:ATP-dependent exoDNAse (exonuclease V) beta subunit
MQAFSSFWEKVKVNLEPVKMEWRVYDKELGIAGTIDFLAFSKLTNHYHILDWKTGKLELESPFGYLKFPFEDLSVASFNKYSLQLSIYRLILERNTGLYLGNSWLVHLKPDGTYQTFQALDLRSKALSWLKGL